MPTHSNINVTVGNAGTNVIVGGVGAKFQPLDYRQGVVDLTSGAATLNFSFSTPFTSEPRFGADIVYNGTGYNDGYGYQVYNLDRAGCNISLTDNIHTTGYQLHYYITAL